MGDPVRLNSPFQSSPRISQSLFTRTLTEASSPWADRGAALYQKIVATGHDPAVWLAIAAREHRYGSNRDSVLWRNDTRSWTNARTVRDPSLTGWSIIQDPIRESNYVKYASVEDSLQDGMFRVTDPSFRYVQENRTTIGDVLAIWSEDGGPYANFVVEIMNRWIGAETMATPYDHVIPGLIDVRDQLATAEPGDGVVERGPYDRVPLNQRRGIVIHYRGVVTSAGAGLSSFKADAEFHVGKNWAKDGEPPILGSGIMYHIGIDGDGKSYLMRDLDRVLWHCGAWPQNSNTLAIQLPLGGDQRATPEQLAELQRICDAWLSHTGAPRTEVWGHKELSPTTCPGTLLADFIQPYRAGALPGPVDDSAVPDEWQSPYGSFWIPKRFVNDIKSRPWIDTGYCLGPATDEKVGDNTILVQYFERARLERQPNGSVTRGLIGSELLAARKEIAELKQQLDALKMHREMDTLRREVAALKRMTPAIETDTDAFVRIAMVPAQGNGEAKAGY